MKILKSALLIALVLSLVLAVACGDDDDDDADDDDDDGDDDADDDVDGDTDDDADDDVNDDADDDVNDDADDDVSDVWTDSTSGLMWQTDSDCCYEWGEAKTYCQNLNWGGYSDWRLPSISELRSLIRGCDDTETGGTCGVSDDCLEASCQDSSCNGCLFEGGPAGGCYWPSQINDDCSLYWSSSTVADHDGSAWVVHFGYGYVYDFPDNSGYPAQCVR